MNRLESISTGASLPCPPGEVHLWRIDLSAAERHRDRYWALLDPTEQVRAQRIRLATNRCRHIVIQGTVRCLLGRYLDRDPAQLRYQRNPHGKPRLADSQPDRGLVFNITHTGDQALVAIGRDLALGVDLERRRPVASLEGLVERCFASSEREYWAGLPEAEQLRAFFDFWTAKEAFVKATGRGLGLGLQRCAFTAAADRLLAIPEECGAPDEWSLWRLDEDERGLSGALCARNGGRPLRLQRRQAGEL